MGIFLLTSASRPTQPPIQRVLGAPSLGAKRPEREAYHSHSPTRPHGVVVKYRKNLPLSFLILPFIYPFTSLSNRYLPLGFPTRMMVTCLPFRMFVTCPVPFHHPSFI